jgi:hypothetical protein
MDDGRDNRPDLPLETLLQENSLGHVPQEYFSTHLDNYFVRNETLKIRSLLEKMMVKNHKERPNLGKVREEIVELFIS